MFATGGAEHDTEVAPELSVVPTVPATEPRLEAVTFCPTEVA